MGRADCGITGEHKYAELFCSWRLFLSSFDESVVVIGWKKHAVKDA
jgi:hypothetical protein